jgi:hypothetical protein
MHANRCLNANFLAYDVLANPDAIDPKNLWDAHDMHANSPFFFSYLQRVQRERRVGEAIGSPGGGRASKYPHFTVVGKPENQIGTFPLLTCSTTRSVHVYKQNIHPRSYSASIVGLEGTSGRTKKLI